VHEASASEPVLPSALSRSPDDPLTAAAFDLMRVVHSMPRQMPPPPSPDRDLTLGQIRLLYLLRRKGPQPMGQIAEILNLSSTAASGFVTRVERHGFVERQHRSDDRRIVDCVLTEAGSQFLDELTGVRIDAIRTALAALTPRELSGFRVLLSRIGARQGEPA
jgi:DNA-binding MarR family transcriptional regulator